MYSILLRFPQEGGNIKLAQYLYLKPKYLKGIQWKQKTLPSNPLDKQKLILFVEKILLHTNMKYVYIKERMGNSRQVVKKNYRTGKNTNNISGCTPM